MEKLIPRILVIDDDPNLLATLSAIFEVKGFKPVTVQTGGEALAQVESQHVDVALIDLRLEDMSGLEVLRGIKARSPETECILLTGHATTATAIEAVQHGAFSYFQKPVDIDQILLSIRRAVEKRQSAQALRESERFAHSTVDALSAHIAILDESGAILAVNRAWHIFAESNSPMGSDLNLFEGANYLSVCDASRGPNSEEAAEMSAGIRAVMSGEQKEFSLEYPCHSPDEKRWFTARVTRFPGEGALRVVVSHENITERKQAEDKIHKLALMLDSASNSITVHDFDGNFLFANQKTFDMHGFTRDEFMALNLHQLDVPASEKLIALNMQKLHELGEAVFEAAHYRKDGSTFSLEVSARVANWGDQQAILSIATDITERKQAEEALRASKEHLRLVTDNMLDLVVRTDLQGIFLYASPSHKSVLGYEPESLLGKSAYDFIHPDDVERVREFTFAALQTEASGKQECRYRHADGHYLWMESAGAFIFDDNGSPIGAVFSTRDITARKQAEEAQQQSESSLQAVLQSTADGILAVSSENEVLYANERFVEMWRIPQVVLTSKEDSVLLQHVLDQLSDPQSFLKKVQELYKSKEESFDSLYFKDGRVFERLSRPLLQGTELRGRVWSFRDITERKQAEEVLRNAEARYRAIFEQSPNGIVLQNLETGETVEANDIASTQLGYTREEFAALRVSDYEALENPEETARHFQKIFREGCGDFETLHRTKSGEIRNIHVIVKPIQLSGRSLFYAIYQDITGRKQAEEALQNSEKRFRTLIENGRDNISMLAADGTLLWESPSTISTLGYAPNQFVGHNMFELVHPDDQGWTRDLYAQILQTPGRSQDGIFRLRHGDGTWRWIESTTANMLNEPSVRAIVINYRDITERKQTEEALRESEKKYQILTEISPVGIFRTDAQGTTTYVNPRWSQISGLSAEAALGDGWLCAVHPEDREKLSEGWKKATSAQTASVTEYRFVRPDGSIAWVLGHSTPERNIEDQIVGYVGTITDITELKKTQKELIESESELRALFASMKDVVIVYDFDGRYVKIAPTNPVNLFRPPDDMLGKTVYEILQKEQADYIVAMIRESIQSNQTVQGEYALQIDGKQTWFSASASRLSETTVVWVAHDITNRKQAEEALRLRESYLTAILENQPGLVWLKDADSRFLAVNQAFADSCGKASPAELAGKTDLDIWPKELAEKYRADDASIIKNKIPVVMEEPIFDRAKTTWFETFKTPILDDKGNVIATTGFSRDITDRKQAEEAIHRRLAELELLYQSGLALGQLLKPKEIAQKIIELLEQKLNWHHTAIRSYHPADDTLELLAFNQPGMESDAEKRAIEERYKTLIPTSGEGFSGWVIRNSQTFHSGDVSSDARYKETFPGIHSGLYTPIKLGERIVGVISIESEEENAFSEADERLLVTLANQAASALENARLFEETQQRVANLETINRISVASRAVLSQDAMLAIVLEEALHTLNASHGSIDLYNKETNSLQKIMARGWPAEVTEPSQNVGEGISGKVFTSGETYISREFASDPATRDISRGQIPPGWGGICMPIRSSQATLGVLIVSVPSERELNKDELRLLTTLSEMTGATLQRMQLNNETARRLQHLQALHAVDLAITSSFDLNPILTTMLTHTLAQLGVDAADILLFRPHLQTLEYIVGQGFRTNLAKSANVRLGDDFAGRVALERCILKSSDQAMLPQTPGFMALWAGEGFESYIGVPLISKGELKGVLEIFNRTPLPANPDWLEFLETLAGQAAIAIDEVQLFDNLQRSNQELSLAYDATIEGWSRAMDLRDEETEGHTQRVTKMTTELAKEFGVNENNTLNMRRGALLHDMGKMGVPDSILLKPGKLTEEEWVVMRRHPLFAYEMLQPIQYLLQALDIPYCHHEKWDGSGYPRGLKGEQIPLAARIFAIVDVWDALTSDRPYRKAWTEANALKYIREESGTHFDPQVVDKFMEIFGKEKT